MGGAWFKHILFTMKRIGPGLKCDEPSPGRIIYKGTHSHTESHNNMSISSKFIISKVAIKYTKLQNYGSYSLSVELINSCTASKTL